MIDDPSRRSELLPLLLAIGIFAALSIWAAITSQGFLEADACTHYLYARFAFQQPHLFVNIWGRPICTGIYALPALIGGRLGVRFMSLLLAIGTSLIAWRIARGERYRWPVLALIFTLAQPLLFLHSFSELTELPFAFMIALVFWAYQKRQWLLMAVIVSWTPLSRPEGFGFVALAALALVLHRRWRWLPVLVVPLVLWSLVGWNLYGRQGHWWTWLSENWPYSEKSLYKPGSIFHFVMLLPVVTGPMVFPMMWLGMWLSVRPSGQPAPDAEAPTSDAAKVDENISGPPRLRASVRSCLCMPRLCSTRFLITAIPLLILVGHSTLYAMGKMASNGEMRYMLVVAPFWALLAAAGWEWVFTRFELRHPLPWAAVAALLPILANVYWQVVPLRPDDDWLRAQRVASWYQSSGIAKQYPTLGAAHPAIFYFLDIPNNGSDRTLDWRQDTLAHPQPGTVLIYDPVYTVFNSDANRKVTLDDLRADGWIDATERGPSIDHGWHILISPADVHGSGAPGTQRSPSRR